MLIRDDELALHLPSPWLNCLFFYLAYTRLVSQFGTTKTNTPTPEDPTNQFYILPPDLTPPPPASMEAYRPHSRTEVSESTRTPDSFWPRPPSEMVACEAEEDKEIKEEEEEEEGEEKEEEKEKEEEEETTEELVEVVEEMAELAEVRATCEGQTSTDGELMAKLILLVSSPTSVLSHTVSSSSHMPIPPPSTSSSRVSSPSLSISMSRIPFDLQAKEPEPKSTEEGGGRQQELSEGEGEEQREEEEEEEEEKNEGKEEGEQSKSDKETPWNWKERAARVLKEELDSLLERPTNEAVELLKEPLEVRRQPLRLIYEVSSSSESSPDEVSYPIQVESGSIDQADGKCGPQRLEDDSRGGTRMEERVIMTIEQEDKEMQVAKGTVEGEGGMENIADNFDGSDALAAKEAMEKQGREEQMEMDEKEEEVGEEPEEKENKNDDDDVDDDDDDDDEEEEVEEQVDVEGEESAGAFGVPGELDEVVSDLESSEAFPTSQTSSVWLDEEDEHRMRQKLTFSKRATHLPAEFRNASEFRDGMSIGERRLADGFCVSSSCFIT